MATRTVSPQGAGGGLGPWAIVAGGALAGISSGSLWVAGGLVSYLNAGAWRSAPFNLLLVVTAAKQGTTSLWPGTAPRTVWITTAVVATIVLVPLLLLALVFRRSARRPADPGRSMAKLVELRHLTRMSLIKRAADLRPSLAGIKGKDLPSEALGWAVGRLQPKGQVLRASWEDVALLFMAPRSGKTTAYGVPPVLEAPGAVVATSNKADLYLATAALRARDTGQAVWVFDPQSVAHVQQTWWWDPLRSVDTVEDADRLASHFVLTVEGNDGKDIWGPAAQELISALIVAAKASGGTLADVYEWLSDESSPLPAKVLRSCGHTVLAASLEGMRTSPPETRGSVYFTARVAMKCMRDPQITAWVTPPRTRDSAESPRRALVEFDPASLPESRQTLYLLSKDGGGSAAPLVAALTDRVMRDGEKAAERSSSGRLDPPMVCVLDEAANICRIGNLPQLYSHLGSRGILPLTILQSYAQAVGVWGENGMKALWSASTVKIVGSGIDDPSFAEDLSRLIGDEDVDVVSVSSGDGKRSRSRSVQQRRILPAADIRALPKGRVLLLTTGARIAMLHSAPWYTGPRTDEIAAARDEANAALVSRAARRDGHAGRIITMPRSSVAVGESPVGTTSEILVVRS